MSSYQRKAPYMRYYRGKEANVALVKWRRKGVLWMLLKTWTSKQITKVIASRANIGHINISHILESQSVSVRFTVHNFPSIHHSKLQKGIQWSAERYSLGFFLIQGWRHAITNDQDPTPQLPSFRSESKKGILCDRLILSSSAAAHGHLRMT